MIDAFHAFLPPPLPPDARYAHCLLCHIRLHCRPSVTRVIPVTSPPLTPHTYACRRYDAVARYASAATLFDADIDATLDY